MTALQRKELCPPALLWDLYLRAGARKEALCKSERKIPAGHSKRGQQAVGGGAQPPKMAKSIDTPAEEIKSFRHTLTFIYYV